MHGGRGGSEKRPFCRGGGAPGTGAFGASAPLVGTPPRAPPHGEMHFWIFGYAARRQCILRWDAAELYPVLYGTRYRVPGYSTRVPGYSGVSCQSRITKTPSILAPNKVSKKPRLRASRHDPRDFHRQQVSRTRRAKTRRVCRAPPLQLLLCETPVWARHPSRHEIFGLTITHTLMILFPHEIFSSPPPPLPITRTAHCFVVTVPERKGLSNFTKTGFLKLTCAC